MIGEKGIEFYDFLSTCAQYENFKVCVSTLPDSEKEKRADEELVLRFIALKRFKNKFRGSVKDWLDNCMEDIIFDSIPFVPEDEAKDFFYLFDYIASILGEGAFVRHRNDKPIGGLAPAYFEAVSLGIWNKLPQVSEIDQQKVQKALIQTIQSERFRSFVGSGSNANQKFQGRIQTIEEALGELINDVANQAN